MKPNPGPRYGASNPERIANPLWDMAFRNDWSGAEMQSHLGVDFARGHQVMEFSGSGYREAMLGPAWSWRRIGKTFTPLLDGRIFHIAGEHEDCYDPNFCIYNDVIVEHPDGNAEFFIYPKEAFLPTDFHSATLVGGDIILIGSLGYADLRRIGETQVLKLDVQTLRIEPLATTGEGPGWVSRHMARLISGSEILLDGGKLLTSDAYEPNTGTFVLDLTNNSWRRQAPGSFVSEDLDRQDFEDTEIALILAGEDFPLRKDALKVLDFFELNSAGNWTCVSPVIIQMPAGETAIRPCQTFSRGMWFAGINDFHAHLQTLAWRADRR